MPHLWFRFYHETLNHPKAQNLSGEMFKLWVNILCLACQNNGVLPPMEDVAFALRATVSETEATVSTLLKATLLDKHKNQHGHTYSPHNWAKRQFKSDSSTERVKRFRNVTSTVTVTPSESDSETDTETESETDKEKSTHSKNRPVMKPEGVPEKVWEDFIVMRRAKHSPITETALKGIEREAMKAGIALGEALTVCCEHSWQGFKASWWHNSKNGRGESLGKGEAMAQRIKEQYHRMAAKLEDD